MQRQRQQSKSVVYQFDLFNHNCVMLSCQYRPLISEECFQNLVESMPRRLTAVLKAKGYNPEQGATSKVYLIKWPVSVYILYINISM